MPRNCWPRATNWLATSQANGLVPAAGSAWGVSPALAEAMIAPSLSGLHLRHPDLRIDLAADDRMADMAREGIDIAIRTGHTASDTVVARQIGEYGRTLCAQPCLPGHTRQAYPTGGPAPPPTGGQQRQPGSQRLAAASAGDRSQPVAPARS
jgi:DNA-binding transcriptional LysR family regulator